MLHVGDLLPPNNNLPVGDFYFLLIKLSSYNKVSSFCQKAFLIQELCKSKSLPYYFTDIFHYPAVCKAPKKIIHKKVHWY